ncbi:MAG TPA: hypothetical protein VJH03_26780 [Blastocatellia bacterium]|nr:hypothetical protein [Blastocatellia bacterium]
MATKALTSVAQRASLRLLPTRPASVQERNWRELLLEDDSDAIWSKISNLVKAQAPGGERDFNLMTQDIFLFLLATQRFNVYLDRQYSEQEITLDILSLLPC